LEKEFFSPAAEKVYLSLLTHFCCMGCGTR